MPQAAFQPGQDLGRAVFQRCAHGLRQVADLGAQLDHQASLGQVVARLQRMPPAEEGEQPHRSDVAWRRQQVIGLLQVALEVPLEQGLAELLLGAEPVIERTFGHPRRGQDLAQAHRGETLADSDCPRRVQDLLARSNGGLCVHGRRGMRAVRQAPTPAVSSAG